MIQKNPVYFIWFSKSVNFGTVINHIELHNLAGAQVNLEGCDTPTQLDCIYYSSLGIIFTKKKVKKCGPLGIRYLQQWIVKRIKE